MSAAVPAVLLCRALDAVGRHGTASGVERQPRAVPHGRSGDGVSNVPVRPVATECTEPAAPVPPSVVLIPAPAEPGLPAVYCVYGPLTGLHGPDLLLRHGCEPAPARYRSDGLCPACAAWWDVDRARRRAGAVA